jgi:hypothetical protein
MQAVIVNDRAAPAGTGKAAPKPAADTAFSLFTGFFTGLPPESAGIPANVQLPYVTPLRT